MSRKFFHVPDLQESANVLTMGNSCLSTYCVQRLMFGAVGVSEMRCNACFGEVFIWDGEQMRDLETCRCMNSLMDKPDLHDAGVQSSLK